MPSMYWIKRVLIATSSIAVLVFLLALGTVHWMAARWSQSEIQGFTADHIPVRDGWDTRYFASGDPSAQRVIFIHGTPGKAADFAAFIRDPVDGLEMVSIDRPGFGGSTPQSAVPALADQAAAIEPLLVERDGRWPILVGHSLGGPIGCRVAADFPDRVGGLVIAAGSLDPDLEIVYFIQHVGDFGPISAILPRVLRNSNRELIPLEKELRELQLLLSGIRAPTIIVHGDEDSLVPVANVSFMTENIPADIIVETVMLKGASHFLPWRQEEVLRDAIRKLAGVSDSK